MDLHAGISYRVIENQNLVVKRIYIYGYRLISEEFLHAFEDRIFGRVCDKVIEPQTIGWEKEMSAPYGWSLEGISSKAGKALLYLSMVGRIFSATLQSQGTNKGISSDQMWTNTHAD